MTVPDGVPIAEALEEAMSRADLIVITGGLGPTSDDVTREAVAEAFGLELVFHQEILEGIAAKFAARKLADERAAARPGDGAARRSGAGERVRDGAGA